MSYLKVKSLSNHLYKDGHLPQAVTRAAFTHYTDVVCKFYL